MIMKGNDQREILHMISDPFPLPKHSSTPTHHFTLKASIPNMHWYQTVKPLSKPQRHHHDPPFVMTSSTGLVGPVDFFDLKVRGNGYSSGSSSSLNKKLGTFNH
jgi:hypothetical protein